ncbi:YhgE/Pip domain-containing protein [[Bacteroides] pectinophilus]|uniref:ABC-2 type transporter transmembrane domain-containing protein n=1 Tax=[Bacteroides] pectinophilus ATCC 43243 TaxID=483218 RepID=B7AV84_9FIRM|nr:YhgE/Pip domain protein [[Bacteroides] pectinophilus ATCC 43243]UWN96037.1 YhgE/Pip domain-containing protein [[Bacteroides] pectinophilus]
MNRIFKIFVHDIVGLSRNIFALIIAGGLCIIPSLYAWFNIYSNWDPYANTSAVKVAVVSEDAGYTGEDGEYSNMGDSVLESLRTNTGLGWQILDKKDDAIEGVKSGEYYAAIVIGDDFSESMFDFIDKGLVHPSVTYYENEKKNAVASKITDTGKSTLQSNINTEFVNTVIQTAMSSTDGMLADRDIIGGVLDNLNRLGDNLDGYKGTIASFVSSNAALSGSLHDLRVQIPDSLPDNSATMEALQNQTSKAADEYIAKLDRITAATRATSQALSAQLQWVLTAIENNLPTDEILAGIDNAQDLLDSMNDQSDTLTEQLQNISDQLGGVIDDDSIKLAVDSLVQIRIAAKGLLEQSKILVKAGALKSQVKLELVRTALVQCSQKIDEMDGILDGSVQKAVDAMKGVISTSIDSIGESLTQVSEQLGSLSAMLGSIEQTVDGMNVGLDQMGSVMDGMSDKIVQLAGKLSDLTGDDKYRLLAQALAQDPETYGEFLSSPVQVETHQVYATENYGSAVSPFYTTLALWVGGLLLTALIKVHPDSPELINGAKPHELFFGRYLLFFVLGQVQAVITVLGDVYLLKIQCLDKGLFMLAACFTSFVFTLLIYALTVSFGDIGKALAVVMVVIQIAGSSGTYPIELLPVFFQKVYIYFPFPYAINAMRETISGRYGSDYWQFMGVLLLFVAASLALGLFIRKPFMKLNHYMHHRMHDTDMM